jgi:two-component system response regulator HydG
MAQPLSEATERREVRAAAPPQVLAVGREGEARRQLAAVLRPHAIVREVAPGDLQRAAALVDAQAAVVLLSGRRAIEGLEALSPLLELPLAASLLLVVRGLADADVEAAIAHLRPLLVLSHPVPPPALRLALHHMLPAGASPGAGSRLQQRRASALLGVSSVIRDVLQKVKQIAPTRVSVLILGETGTGKELVARAIHEQSPRAHRSFVAVNCSALPDTLLEAELFGARKGAFTGADRNRKGLFLEADGGTLFLDEIGDTSPAFQAKLLRAIETQEIRPLGGTEVRRVDVRIVSATHRELEAAIADGDFRQDLLYRLNTMTIEVPPLRRRRVDIPFLAQHFAEEFGDAHARRIVLDEGLLDALGHQEFPGNVRELRNAVERALALAADEDTVTTKHLELGGTPLRASPTPRSGNLRDRVEQVELEAIREALAESGGNRTQAAKALGLSRLGLREKMRRLGLETPRKR